MVEETTDTHGLWLHQESVIIGAQSHELWGFSPEFLQSNDIVQDDWSCRLATRDQNTVTINYGPIQWRMTEMELWISKFPECLYSEAPQSGDEPIVAVMAHRYLETVPYLPSRRFMFFWRFSAIKPNPDQWMLDSFLNNNSTIKSNDITIQPTVTLGLDGLSYQFTVKKESIRRRRAPVEHSIVFDCYAYHERSLDVKDMISETNYCAERLRIVEETIRHLLEEVG